ncbi:MAG: hypothetical protein ABSC21_21450 [Terriglobia bacterium]
MELPLHTERTSPGQTAGSMLAPVAQRPGFKDLLVAHRRLLVGPLGGTPRFHSMR